MSNPARRTVSPIIIVIAWIVAVWIVAFIAAGSANTNQTINHSANPLDRWDAAFYQGFATGQPVERQHVVTPLYGWMAGGFMKITGLNFGAVSALVSTGLAVVAILLALKTVTSYFPTLNQTTTALLLLSAPAAFVMLAPYPVSLLFLFSILAWRGLHGRNIWMAMIPAILAPLAHPIGIIMTVVACAMVITWQKPRAIIISAAMLSVAAFMAFQSGLIASFLSARNGYTDFSGVHFWTFGSWWLTRSASTGINALMLAAIAHTLIGSAKAVYDGWSSRWYPTLTLAGFMLTTIFTGLWIGLPRYLLPSPAPAIAVAPMRPAIRWSLIITGFIIQAAWIWNFVSWKAFI